MSSIDFAISEAIRTANISVWNGTTVESVEDFYEYCDQRLSLIKNPVENILYRYVLPIQIILGIAGNTINLIVLLSSGMRSEANVLLSAMAFADISLLLCQVPSSVSVYATFYMNLTFRYFYYSTHIFRHGLSNMFSAAASWLVLAVSLERYIGIRSPMHTRLQWRDWRVFVTILIIFIAAFLVSSYHFVEHQYEFLDAHPCQRVFIFARLMSKFDNSTAPERLFINEYVNYAKMAQILTVVVIPFIFIPFFNISIIRVLRNRDVLVNRTYISAAPKPSEDFVRRYSDIGIRQRQERKVTATVVAIITCHIFTHILSPLPFVWELLKQYGDSYQFVNFLKQMLCPEPNVQRVASSIINSVLLTGKVLNFVLFCLSSAHFRRRLGVLIRIHCVSGLAYKAPSRHKKYSSVASNSQQYKSGQHVKMCNLRNEAIQRQSSCTTQVESCA